MSNKTDNEYIEVRVDDLTSYGKQVTKTLRRTYKRKQADQLFKDLNELVKGLTDYTYDEESVYIDIDNRSIVVEVLSVVGDAKLTKEDRAFLKNETDTSVKALMGKVQEDLDFINVSSGRNYKIVEE